MIKKMILLFCIGIMTFLLQAGTPVSLTWAFLYQKNGAEIKSLAADQGEISLSDGDKIRILFSPGEQTYVYLFFLDPEQNLYLLFPERISYFDLFYETGTDYAYPGEDWTEIIAANGKDEFILLASSERLKSLEKLVKDYNRLLYNNRPDGERLTLAGFLVLEEIQELKHRHSAFTRGAKEGVGKIACKVRGTEKGEYEGIVVQAINFYSQTIRIQYRERP